MSYKISKASSLFKEWIYAMYCDEGSDMEWYKTTKRLVIRNVFSSLNCKLLALMQACHRFMLLLSIFANLFCWSWEPIPRFCPTPSLLGKTFQKTRM
jgi:hypothetical protein